tara:strand:+ start:493 stop:2334 length:1842 start_codon:yes stop_codon:yes gene_type:complete
MPTKEAQHNTLGKPALVIPAPHMNAGAAGSTNQSNAMKMIAEIRDQWSNGQQRKARKLCSRLQKQYPDLPDALHIHALMDHQDGQSSDAIHTLEKACNSPQSQSIYFIDLAAILNARGYESQAKAVLQQGLVRWPLDPKLLLQMGILLARGHTAHQAIPVLKRTIALTPNEWLAWNAMGAAYLAQDNINAAIYHFQVAEKRAHDAGHTDGLIDTRISQGECLRELGNLKGARAIFEDILARLPGHIRAWYCLTLMGKVAADHPSRKTMIDLAASNRLSLLPSGQKELLLFSLAKAHMDAGEIDPAMKNLAAANHIKRQSLSYSPQSIETVFNVTRAAFPASRFKDLEPPHDSPDQPSHIFVIGMPRSGTTLVEQILSSHPSVFGAGELDVLGYHQDNMVEFHVKQGRSRDAVLKFDDAMIKLLGDVYRKKVRDRITKINTSETDPNDFRRIVDKMPGNFVRAGLIALMHPNSRIIHCRRDPMDTCFSCYNRRFGRSQNFSYDQHELGAFYSTYLKFMDHWRNVLPAHRFIEVNYEDIVNDLDGHSRRLINFSGLPWHDGCLEFHKTERQIRTHSALQVRQPIYRSSIGAWRPYAAHLGPLMESLGITMNEQAG